MRRTCSLFCVVAFGFLQLTAQLQQASSDSSAPVTVFRAESRQILIGAVVSDGPDKPVRGLTAQDFHLFENDKEQRLNYLKEISTADEDITRQWDFWQTPRGVWATPMPPRTSAFSVTRIGMVSYLVGYTPRALAPGECRTIKAVVAGHDVSLNRSRYCGVNKPDPTEDAKPADAKLDEQMRKFSTSRRSGEIKVSAKTFVFRSDGTAHFDDGAGPAPGTPGTPTQYWKYFVEEREANAPGRVHITAEFTSPKTEPELVKGSWHLTFHVLGIVTDAKKSMAAQFRDDYDIFVQLPASVHVLLESIAKDARVSKMKSVVSVGGTTGGATFSPRRYDTQTDLPPGEYELTVVVSDGKNFGKARVPLRVESFEPKRLAVSDLALSTISRPPAKILEDEALISPWPLIPTPLVSDDKQYFPLADTRFTNRVDGAIYFEVYEPLPDAEAGKKVQCHVRILDKKRGAIKKDFPILSLGPTTPGNPLIPVALKVSSEGLAIGSYKLDLQVSDEAGLNGVGRTFEFTIEKPKAAPWPRTIVLTPNVDIQ